MHGTQTCLLKRYGKCNVACMTRQACFKIASVLQPKDYAVQQSMQGNTCVLRYYKMHFKLDMARYSERNIGLLLKPSRPPGRLTKAG
jgi:hypothetical protein